MHQPDFSLKDGSKIAIIGAGPAGTFFAHFALKLAQTRGLKIEIIIFDAKKFISQGPAGCNMCAGIISESLIEKLNQEGLQIPENRVQQRIEGYYLHTRADKFLLYHPRHKKKIITVFRGNGPRLFGPAGNISFDDFLLDYVKQQGVEVISEMVEDLALPHNPAEPLCLTYGDDRKKVAVDLVVGAFGLNSKMADKIKKLNFGFVPPRSVISSQAEIELGEEYIQKTFGNQVFLFTLGEERMRYVALIPKGEYLTVSIIGKKNVHQSALQDFLNSPLMRKYLPPDWKIPKTFCHCYPRIATVSARHPFTHRLVMIGDASFCRYYKNGIESAWVTARLAADAAYNLGVSRQAFKSGYEAPARKIIVRDNFYGRLLFTLNDIIAKFPLIAQAHLRLIKSRRPGLTGSRLTEILWNMFTGNLPYRKIFFKTLHPLLQLKLWAATLAIALKHPFSFFSTANLLPLSRNQTVVIIGGGPAGTSCGIALKNLGRARGTDLRVILYEAKEYESEAQYNQCLGVVSPPIKDIFTEKLKIPFPEQLVQRTIRGYVLHSPRDQIRLEKVGEVSYALRRVTLDKYLLRQAEKLGVEIIQSRVTDLEFYRQKVMVYSESDNREADMLVGAFGLDSGSIRIFEENTAYRPPRYLSSIVTKVHPGEQVMAGFENYIHAFLPAPREIEFGAITPKGNHLTINIAGRTVTAERMNRFLDSSPVKRVLPLNFDLFRSELNYYKGKFPVSAARNFWGDRYVLIGDAAGLVRPFKGKGINSACLAGFEAAQIMLEKGISRQAFKSGSLLYKEIRADLPFARLIRRLAVFCARTPWFDRLIGLAKQEPALSRFLYSCVSASQSYRSAFQEAFSLRLFFRMLRALF